MATFGKLQSADRIYAVGDVVRMRSDDWAGGFGKGWLFPDAVILYLRTEAGIAYAGLARPLARTDRSIPFADGGNHLAATPLLSYERFEVPVTTLDELYLHASRQ